MIYGYARVSTAGQATNGNSLEEQIKQLKERGAVEIITEHYTGKTTDRPKFNELISRLDAGDTLMVTKLDRFARSVVQGLKTVQELISKGVTIHVLNMGILDNSPMNQVTMTMFLAFAEFERAMIVERTQAGKEVAKTKAGFKEGRPRVEDKDKGKAKLIELAMEKIDTGVWTYRQAERETGISFSTLHRRYNNYKKGC